MFEQEINKICNYYNWDNFTKFRNTIKDALSLFLGLQGKEQVEIAIKDYDESFTKADGLGKLETSIVINEDGSATLRSSIEFVIKNEYLGFIPVVANELPVKKVAEKKVQIQEQI